MKKTILAIATLILITGCNNQPLTPEQKAKRQIHWNSLKAKHQLAQHSNTSKYNNKVISIDGISTQAVYTPFFAVESD